MNHSRTNTVLRVQKVLSIVGYRYCRSLSAMAGLVWIFGMAATLYGQANYTIDWYTVDGGGGTSTGGLYSISGTIGQPDAGGPMTNGPYTLTGGFWALPTAVQNTNAPTLTITPASPGFATISWAPNTPGFMLQETLSLSLMWSNSASGTTNPIVVPAVLPTRFYRLFRP